MIELNSVSPVMTLSIAQLLMTKLTGANFKANKNMVDQQNDLMKNQGSWSTAAKWTSVGLGLFSAITMVTTPLVMGRYGVPSSLSADILDGVGSVGKAATGSLNSIANGKVEMDQQKVGSSQAVGQGFAGEGNQVLTAGQDLEKAIGQYISNRAQAIHLMPVRR